MNFNINWTKGRHSVFWQSRLIDSVVWDGGWSGARHARVLRATGRDIGSYSYPDNPYTMPATWWSDVYYTLELPVAFGMQGMTATVGVRNVFEEEPPVANNANGYSAILHDARGRMLMFRFRASF